MPKTRNPTKHGTDGPACPNCGSIIARVFDVRMITKDTKHRRRQCCSCDARFSTYEVLRDSRFSMKDGRAGRIIQNNAHIVQR